MPTANYFRAQMQLVADTLRTSNGSPDAEGDAGSLAALVTRELEDAGDGALARLLQAVTEADSLTNEQVAEIWERTMPDLPSR
jgi:hypothetical protein